jgi:hypothetical protein
MSGLEEWTEIQWDEGTMAERAGFTSMATSTESLKSSDKLPSVFVQGEAEPWKVWLARARKAIKHAPLDCPSSLWEIHAQVKNVARGEVSSPKSTKHFQALVMQGYYYLLLLD